MMRQARSALFVLLAGIAPMAVAQEGGVSVRGFVTEAGSRQALPGANVTLTSWPVRLGSLSRGVAADDDGFFQLPPVPEGRYVLQVTFVGYVPFRDTLDLAGPAALTRSVTLQAGAASLDELRVEAEGGAATVEAGLQAIRPGDLARIPTPDVSGDLASYLTALPGVVSLGDRGGGLYVRGGTPSQNLVLMDGAVVYQPFHIIGFFSAFPEELVANADFHAGGFGARYSGRLSSVLDVTMRQGHFEQAESAASLSPFLFSIRGEGPLERGRVSLLGSIRTSLIERSGSLFGTNLPFRFGDVFLKVTRADGQRGRCSLSGLFTYDRGGIDPDAPAGRRDVFRWRNTAASARCILIPPDQPYSFESRLSLSRVQNDVGVDRSPERRSDALLVDAEVRLTRVGPRVQTTAGLFTRADFLGYRLGGQFTDVQENDRLVLSSGGYVEVQVRPLPALTLVPGVVATSFYGDFRPSLEPRLRAGWQPGGPDGRFSASGAVGVYRQTINGISDERDAGSVFIAWLPHPVGGGRAKAIHALAGVRQRLGPFALVLEGYRKTLHDLAVPIWSAVARFTTRLAPADGSVRGLDARIEWQRGSGYAFLGYGLSETEYRLDQSGLVGWPEAGIQRYAPPHDRRHQLNAVLGGRIGAIDASIRWQYGSGLPFTRPYGFDTFLPLHPLPDVREQYGIPRVLYRRPYGGRLPAYHRLDLSLERAFVVGNDVLVVQVGAVNLYNRDNLFYFDLFTVRRVDQLPLVPFVGLKYEPRRRE
jgi:hypothetical protein